jgi:hypothetical protein
VKWAGLLWPAASGRGADWETEVIGEEEGATEVIGLDDMLAVVWAGERYRRSWRSEVGRWLGCAFTTGRAKLRKTPVDVCVDLSGGPKDFWSGIADLSFCASVAALCSALTERAM